MRSSGPMDEGRCGREGGRRRESCPKPATGCPAGTTPGKQALPGCLEFPMPRKSCHESPNSEDSWGSEGMLSRCVEVHPRRTGQSAKYRFPGHGNRHRILCRNQRQAGRSDLAEGLSIPIDPFVASVNVFTSKGHWLTRRRSGSASASGRLEVHRRHLKSCR